MIGFTNPWMLAGLAAVGLPVLIHFLTRARPRRIAFPPCRFLVEACAGQQAVHRLRTFLLLAARTLAVLALVLMFTRPFSKPSALAGGAETSQRAVLIVDASLSMRAVQRGTPLFARAQAEAAELLRALDPATEAAVILAGAAPRPLLPALSRNHAALHEALVKARPTFEHGDPVSALALATKILGGTGTLYLFSDFQKSNWETVSELPGGVLCRLRPVTTEAVENVAVTSVRFAPAEPAVGEPAEVLCTLLNSSARPRQETVRLELGDVTRETRVSLPPFGIADAVFNVTFPRPGPSTGQVSLDPDDLREDNLRHIAVRVQKTLQILLISDAEAHDQRSAAFFVSRALAPSAEAAPGLKLVRRHSQDADRGILETADVFVLVAPALPAGEALEIISRRVLEGAHYLALLDGPTAPALIPPAFSPPFQLQRPVRSDTGERVTPGSRKLFADGDSEEFAPLRFRRHYLNQVLPGRAEDVLFSYSDGSAALTLGRAGKGSVVFGNLPMTPDASDLAGSPVLPAMLHELLRQARRGSEERAVTPGLAWTLDAPTVGETPVQVTDPGGQPIQGNVLSSGRITRLALSPAEAPGLYLARQGAEIVAAAAVNVDARESDTRPQAIQNLAAGKGGAVSVLHDEGEVALAGRTRPLWPLLAAVGAGALALEMLLLAWWRPNRARPGTPPTPLGQNVTYRATASSARKREEVVS